MEGYGQGRRLRRWLTVGAMGRSGLSSLPAWPSDEAQVVD